eukprot:4892564-Heterocapsa_arctica.AAC.1
MRTARVFTKQTIESFFRRLGILAWPSSIGRPPSSVSSHSFYERAPWAWQKCQRADSHSSHVCAL